MIREGDKRRSILTGKVYKVKIIKDGSVGLESVNGLSQVWTERGTLKLFYKNVEEKNLGDLELPLKRRPHGKEP